jgi:enamine deaminase RidA (YjgF/YER057c/UK114 family)
MMRGAVKIAIKGAAALIAVTGLAAAQSPERVKTLAPEGAIKPTGTWSLGSRAGDFVYVAGMRGIDPKTNTLVQGEEARVRQGFLNMQMIAESEGASLRDCVRLVVYVTDMVPVPAAGEQGAGGAVGQGAVSAAHHRRGAPPQSGRHIRGRGHFLRTGEKVTQRRSGGLGLAAPLRYI